MNRILSDFDRALGMAVRAAGSAPTPARPSTPDTASRLVVTEFGVGFWDADRQELRKTFGVQSRPAPIFFGTPSDAEVALYYHQRGGIAAELRALYDRKTRTGGYAGD